MITTNLVPSSAIKEFETLLELRLPITYRKYKREKALNEPDAPPQPIQPDPFKGWNMPETPMGYIKPRKNNLL